jgi:hypothetical protein
MGGRGITGQSFGPFSFPAVSLPIPTIDENPTGPAPDPSLIDLPPGCFTPPSSPTADIPISAGAMDYPGGK